MMNHITERAIYFLAFGHALLFLQGNLEEDQLVLRILDMVLAGLGFVFIGRALRHFNHAHLLWWGFVVVSTGYFVAQVLWTRDLFLNPQHVKISDAFLITFAVCKVVFSSTFLALVWLIPPQQGQQLPQAAHAGGGG